MVLGRARREDSECRACSVQEAARVLGLSRIATYGAIYRGEIPAFRLGQRIVVPKDARQKLLENPSMVRDQSLPPPRRWGPRDRRRRAGGAATRYSDTTPQPPDNQVS